MHVKKVMGSENAGIQSKKSKCIDYMQVAWRTMCKHLKEVGKNVLPDSIILSPEIKKKISHHLANTKC